MTTMHNAEEISKWLGCLITSQHPCEAGCPFNPHPGMMWPYGCIKGQRDIVEEAREMLHTTDQTKGATRE